MTPDWAVCVVFAGGLLIGMYIAISAYRRAPLLGDIKDDRTLTRAELQLLRRLDGPPPVETVRTSRSVHPMAIRAVREILQARVLLTRLISCPTTGGQELVDLRKDVIKLLQGTLNESHGSAPSSRQDATGVRWLRIGRYDDDKRRSLWMKDNGVGMWRVEDGGTIELRAGREGGDAQVVIEVNEQNKDLVDCLRRAWYSAEYDKVSAEDARQDAEMIDLFSEDQS